MDLKTRADLVREYRAELKARHGGYRNVVDTDSDVALMDSVDYHVGAAKRGFRRRRPRNTPYGGEQSRNRPRPRRARSFGRVPGGFNR
jgi:hypothetical protein